MDLLNGPVVFDDARIDHLVVLRQRQAGDRVVVLVRCLPVSIFGAEYDRAFRLLSELDTVPDEPLARFVDGLEVQRIWGLDRFDRDARDVAAADERVLSLIEELDAEHDAEVQEDPDRDVDLDIPSGFPEFANPETRARARAHLGRTVAFARGDQLSDQGFDARDRPGALPRWLEQAQTSPDVDVVALGGNAPGCFVLPAPAEQSAALGEPDWSQIVAWAFAQRAGRGLWQAARFGGPIALDIAFRGRAGRRSDIDNAARVILREFERTFASNALRIDGYRAYRRPAATDDVRVRVMPAVRLELLSRAMDDARSLCHG